MKHLLNVVTKGVPFQFNGIFNDKDLSLLSIEKLQTVICYLDKKLFETEYRIHFDSDKMQKDLENWVEKERQKIHFLEEARHTLLERNLKKQTKIRDMQEYMLWGRTKNKEIIMDNSVVLKEIGEFQERNGILRERFKELIEITRQLENKRREQLKIFKKLYRTTPRYKNQGVQTEEEVKNMVSTRVKRGHKTFKEKGAQCEIVADRARIIGHKRVMTDKAVEDIPLIILDESVVVESESYVTVTSDTNLDAMLGNIGDY